MEIVEYLLAKKKAEASAPTVEQLSVTENGTYSEEGIAYSPVVVNVPAPENSYQLTDLPTGAVSTIADGTALPMPSLKAGIEPIQDLHGYDHPWAGGAGKNLLPYPSLDNGWINGYLYSSGGTIAPASSERQEMTSDYIPINAGLSYMFSFALNEPKDNWIGLLFFDSTKTPIVDRIVIWSSTTLRVTAPAEAMYVRISFRTYGIVSWVQLEAGSTATSYEPYSNICPISGWTAANVTRSGKNLLPKLSTGSTTVNGVTFTVNSDGSITVNGTATSNAALYINRDIVLPQLLPDTYYTFSGAPQSASDSTHRVQININGRTTAILTGGTTKTFPTPSIMNRIDIYIIVMSGTTVNNEVYYPMIELGSTATTYEPYNGTTYNIQFTDGDNPLTVYGGTLNATTGELVVDRVMLTFTESDLWVVSSNNVYLSVPDGDDGEIISDILEYGDYSGNAKMVGNNHRFYIWDAVNVYNVTTREEAQTFFKDHTVIYYITTPQTYQLTPTQIRTLVGNNNILADTGDIIEGKYFKEL